MLELILNWEWELLGSDKRAGSPVVLLSLNVTCSCMLYVTCMTGVVLITAVQR